jgi:hypothetical protein
MFLPMDAPPAPGPADPTAKMAHNTYYILVHTLCTALPLLAADDNPEHVAHRNADAIARVAGLRPANTDEAYMAANYVAAQVLSFDCLRQAREHEADIKTYLRCTAQSASMMRQARSWRSLLLRAQAVRQNREADKATRPAQPEQQTVSVMADALRNAPPPARPVPQRAAPVPEADPDPTLSAPPVDAIAEAERYAVHHRKRAILIRRLGRLPDKLNVGSVQPEVVRAIASGTTPILCALDDKPARGCATA